MTAPVVIKVADASMPSTYAVRHSTGYLLASHRHGNGPRMVTFTDRHIQLHTKNPLILLVL